MQMNFIKVAPLVGAWIESRLGFAVGVSVGRVAPLVGAWIESIGTEKVPIEYIVAPLVGAWIERTFGTRKVYADGCRSSCRSVD